MDHLLSRELSASPAGLDGSLRASLYDSLFSFEGDIPSTIETRLVAMAEGTHSFPFRTRPLSPPAPMVLVPKGTGRVGRCQAGVETP